VTITEMCANLPPTAKHSSRNLLTWNQENLVTKSIKPNVRSSQYSWNGRILWISKWICDVLMFLCMRFYVVNICCPFENDTANRPSDL